MSPPPPGSVYEIDEDILQALRVGLPAPPALSTGSAVPPVAAAVPGAGWVVPPPAATPARVAPFRPTHRPPTSTLVVCDDGRPDGEIVRVRADRFVIGRTDGDLLIPHDDQISARHAEITRQTVARQTRWVLTDLQSTNGLFVRVRAAALADRAEFLVGAGRYRLDAPTLSEHTVDRPAPGPAGTVGWGAEASPLAPPALVELPPGGGVGNRYVLTRSEYWIGADPGCPIARPDDPFCDPRHARLFRDAAGGWHVEHRKAVNGLWLRVPQIAADKGCVFQLGEQRFRFVPEGAGA